MSVRDATQADMVASSILHRLQDRAERTRMIECERCGSEIVVQLDEHTIECQECGYVVYEDDEGQEDDGHTTEELRP